MTMKDTWQETARNWSREILARRSAVAMADHDMAQSLWAQAMVLDRFSCFDMTFTAQSASDILDTLPKSHFRDPAKLYQDALTALVRGKKLRSWTKDGVRYYELNLN